MDTEYVTVTPAYGRDYTSKAAALKDWTDGKDFIEARSGRYMSIRDADKAGSKMTVMIRYAKLRKICSTK